MTWALYDHSFELCLWWRSHPLVLWAVDWSDDRIMFSMERYA